MMTGTVTKIQKSDVIHHRSHMTQIQGSYCKGICKNHKAKRDNYIFFECTNCIIFLKPEGTHLEIGKPRCSCCNFLVKPMTYSQQSKINVPKPDYIAERAREEAREKQNE